MNSLRTLWDKWFVDVCKHYIDFIDETHYTIFGCWILGSYLYEEFETFPYLYFCGTKQSGKSKALMLLQKLCPRAELSITASVPAIFRAADKWKSTLLFDEMEQLNGDEKSELRSLLYSGYKRGGYALRCPRDSKMEEPLRFSVYCPKALCSINRPDSILSDRCITINMRRTLHRGVANSSIPSESWNFMDKSENNNIVTWSGLRKQLDDGIKNSSAEIEKIYRSLDDDDISGRSWELWHPLLSIAKFLGDDVYVKLRQHILEALKLQKEEDLDSFECTLIRILADQMKSRGK